LSPAAPAADNAPTSWRNSRWLFRPRLFSRLGAVAAPAGRFLRRSSELGQLFALALQQAALEFDTHGPILRRRRRSGLLAWWRPWRTPRTLWMPWRSLAKSSTTENVIFASARLAKRDNLCLGTCRHFHAAPRSRQRLAQYHAFDSRRRVHHNFL